MAKSINRVRNSKDTRNIGQSAENSLGLTTNIRHALSGWPMILGWLAMLIFAFHASTHMVGAGDTWVAMACGRHFINQGVDTVEPFSANSHKAGPTEKDIAKWPGWAKRIANKFDIETVKYWHPTGWVNQNWLTHVIFYWLTHESPIADPDAFPPSFNQLVYWKIALYIIAVICVYYTGRILGVNPALSAVFACFAMFIGRSFFDVRPAGFSNVLVAAFLLILALTTYRNFLYIWLLVPILVFWCNVHGGYIYALMLTPFVILHMLIILPKRWTISFYSILMWMALYFRSFTFTRHLNTMGEEILRKTDLFPVSPGNDWLLFVLILMAIASLTIAAVKKVKNEAFYAFHIVATLILFLWILSRFFPSIPKIYAPQALKPFHDYVNSSLLFFIITFFGLIGMALVMTFWKDKLVSIKPKAIYHTIAAGFVAFIATIVFNPFHLTNLTHTVIISVSKHAKMWRTVNEWHPAFEWTNPVGTSFPFLVMYVLIIGLALLWLLSRLLNPKFLKAQRDEFEEQKKLFKNLSNILGFATAVLVCWATLISFSLLNLSATDFIICAAFVGIIFLSIYRNVHFITLVIPLILLATGFVDPEWLKVLSRWFKSPELLKNIPTGYNGRYIYPFILLPAYVTMHIFASLFSKNVIIKQKNIIFPAIAAIVNIVLVVLLINPFKFAKPIWHVTQFFDLSRRMRPVYERNVEVSYTHLFSALYMLSILSIIIWLLLPYLRKVFSQVPNKIDENPPADTYQLPKIDLALIAIAVFTTYMAIQSRRFIPIAAVAACPVLAMFIGQMVHTVSASRNFHRQNRLIVSPMPQALQLFFIVIGAAFVLISGIGWGLKFKRVYLDGWPTDTKLNSVFMRMTASDAKPFYASRFIRDNKIEGKVFNYWTEGGFIAYGQNPDPNTGRTPLRLFMDGRAQAAYEPAAYKMWSDIMSGGPVVYETKRRNRTLNVDDYKKIGKWIDKRLKDQKVWVVLMPTGQFETPFVKGLEQNTNWPVVFYNNKQKLFVDISTPQGKNIFDGIFNGKTLYPDPFSTNLIKARSWFAYIQAKDAKKQALAFAKEAFLLSPSQAPMRQVMLATRYPELRSDAEAFIKNYFDDFEKNRAKWAKQHGYHHRIAAALNACSYFRELAKRQNDTKLMQSYDTKMSQYHSERQVLLKTKRW
ncbi:MAG: hypothetical protein FVQ85_19270 [Planctomycetes bacterium]|nr:hypothetical protein [Planctomycetota bacterium]